MEKVAPNGYPSHSRLRTTLEGLHAKYGILGNSVNDVGREATVAADQWRIMAKDCLRLTRSGTRDPELSKLVRLVSDQDLEQATSDGGDDSVAKLFPTLDDIDHGEEDNQEHSVEPDDCNACDAVAGSHGNCI